MKNAFKKVKQKFEQKDYFWKVKQKIKKKFPELSEEDVDKMLSSIPYGLPLPMVDMMLISTRAIYDTGEAPKLLEKIRDKIKGPIEQTSTDE